MISLRRCGLCVLAVALSIASGCQGGMMHAVRGDATGASRPAYLVEMRDKMPAVPTRIVSVSFLDVAHDRLALGGPSESDRLRMRENAAERQAEMLVFERVDGPYKRGYYGLGLQRVADGEPVKVCAHEAAMRGVSRARTLARRCLTRLKKRRRGIKGEVTVIFEVDAFGGVHYAAPAPGSTRDTEVQACLLKAVHDADYGPPDAFFCRLELGMTL